MNYENEIFEEEMIKNSFEWDVVYSYTTEKDIIRLIDNKPIKNNKYFKSRNYYKPKKYNVFDVKDIYETFARINTDKASDIDDFVNKYGILGLSIEEKIENLQDKFLQYKNIVEHAVSLKSWENLNTLIFASNQQDVYESVFYKENLEDFTREVKLMRAILTLNKYEQLKVTDMKEISVLMKDIEDLANIDFDTHIPDDLIKSDYILLNYKAKALISAVICMKMKNVKPKLSIIFKNEAPEYVNTWQPVSLLGCMYTMLFNDLSQGTKMSTCTVCGNPLIMRNKGKRWHTDCRGKKNTESTRERVTNEVKEYIVKKYNDKSNIETVKIYEDEKDGIVEMFGGTAKDIFNKKRINTWLNRK